VAEGLAGSEEGFVERMNAKAKEFGMMGTHFANSSGWPDPDHYTTARDLAILAHHVVADFPEYYHYFSEINFTYHGIKQGNRNPLLNERIGVDGIKTGYAEGPGYSLVSSGVHEGRRIIIVPVGNPIRLARGSESSDAHARWSTFSYCCGLH
jgi:D-alanyl-D-alanine carboxypeptidase (penicillin-binding protein 5/6)